jgi:hypothetical protein
VVLSLDLIGIKGINLYGISGNALLFLLVIVAAIAWMVHEAGKEKG